MRIMLVNTFYYPEVKGGAEYSIKKLAEGLVKAGNNVVVLVSGKENADENINGVDVKRRRFASLYHSYGDVKKNIFTKFAHRMLDFDNRLNLKIIKKEIDGFKPDVIHTNNLYEITPIVWLAANRADLPVVHTLRDYYLLCPKTNLVRKDMRQCRNSRIVCKAYQNINRHLSNRVDILTTPSKMMMDKIEEYNMFQSAQKCVVYNAEDFELSEVQKRIDEKEKDTPVRFVYLGGLHKHKGIETLISAFREIKRDNTELVLAGKGDLEPLVREACTKDKRIKFKGFLDEEKMHELLTDCSVLICPSTWDEPFGRVILDAYSFGLPVIASKIGALPELVNHKETGFLFTAGNSAELSRIMEYVCDNPSCLVEFRNNIIDKLSEFSLKKQIGYFENIYLQALSNEMKQ